MRALRVVGVIAVLISRSLPANSALWLVGLALVYAGVEQFSRAAAFVIIGLLIIRDAESPDPSPRK